MFSFFEDESDSFFFRMWLRLNIINREESMVILICYTAAGGRTLACESFLYTYWFIDPETSEFEVRWD